VTNKENADVTLPMAREHLYAAVVSDVLDAMGFPNQSPRVPLPPLTSERTLLGRCKTTLWGEMYHVDPRPYELELKAVDSCQPDDVLIAAAGGSLHSGVWGELLSTAARNRGCIGAIVDGAVRDIAAMRRMDFAVFARGRSVYDSKDRQRVVDLDVPVAIAGVMFHPGDLVIADADGVVVVPRALEGDVLRRAWEKVHAENVTRDAIRQGMLSAEAYAKYGVL